VAYCATSFGISLFVAISIFFRVTGGVFNPAISLALFATKGLTLVRFVLYFIAQIVASIVAAYLLQALHPGATSVVTTLNPTVSYARGVWIEAFTTFLLVITVLVTATDKRHVAGKHLAPLSIAASLWIGHLWAIPYTGAGMNPARSFGPSVPEGFYSDQWVYWVGPFVGTVIAVAIFKCLQFTEYWTFGNCWDHTEDQTMVDESRKGKRSILPLFESDKRPPSSPDTAIFNNVLPALDHAPEDKRPSA
jgi:aquaporin related protein